MAYKNPPKEHQFKKGNKLGGRTLGAVGLKTKLKEALQRIHEGTGTRYDELFIQATIKDGIKADGQSRRLIWQYIEGLPQQNLDIMSGGKPLPIYAGKSINTISRHDSNKENIQSDQKD